MLSVIMLRIKILSVVMPSAILLSVVMTCVLIPSVLMLSVITLSEIMFADHYTDCCYADAKCRYAECHYTDRRCTLPPRVKSKFVERVSTRSTNKSKKAYLSRIEWLILFSFFKLCIRIYNCKREKKVLYLWPQNHLCKQGSPYFYWAKLDYFSKG